MLRFLLHVPKTGGTSFRSHLRTKHDVALWYGAAHPQTHPILRATGRVGCPETLAELERYGFRFLQGHFRAKDIEAFTTDPRRMWIWLRDPVDRLASAHRYLLARGKTGLSLSDFLTVEGRRSQYLRYTEPHPIEAFGFVGITEQMAAYGCSERLNRTAGEPPSSATRAHGAKAAVADYEIYDAALRLSADAPRQPLLP